MLEHGTRVQTTLPDPQTVTQWTNEVWLERKWGVTGSVQRASDSHGLCYEVRHDDGTMGWYDPSELETVTGPLKRPTVWERLLNGD